MLIKTGDWADIAYEAKLYNEENGTNLEAFQYLKQVYHAEIENAQGPGNLEMTFESSKWESYYLMKRFRPPWK